MLLTIPNVESSPTFDSQAVPDSTDWNALISMNVATGVSQGCQVTPHTGLDMNVAIAAGTVVINGKIVQVTAVASKAIAAADATDRRDIIVVSNAGAVSVVKGTDSATAGWSRSSTGLPPVKPAIPANSCLLAEVYVASTTTVIASGNIVDKTPPIWLGMGPVFNVLWYGATGNGSTDDSTTCQAAITAASAANSQFAGIHGTVYFPGGSYLLTAAGLTCAVKGGVSFVGDGPPGMSTTLATGNSRIVVGSGLWGLTTGTSSTGFEGFVFKNLEFYEQSAGTALGGIHHLATGYSQFDNCAFGAFTQYVTTTFNGTPGSLTSLSTVLTLISATGWLAAGGSGRIVTSGTQTLHSFTYTGVSGSTLTGVTYSGTAADTVGAAAVVTADMGIGGLIDNTATGDGPYSVLTGCKFGQCTVGLMTKRSNGNRVIACAFDGANNGTSYTTGSIGLLPMSGDSLIVVGCIFQGYDTLVASAGTSNLSITASRFEIWNTAGVNLLGGSGNGPCSAHIAGSFDNTQLSAGGTGVIVGTGTLDALIEMHVYPASVTTPISDSGTRTKYDIYNGTSSTHQQPAAKYLMPGLPTSNPGVTGQLWNNSGVLTVS
jgi:hypothetical protein